MEVSACVVDGMAVYPFAPAEIEAALGGRYVVGPQIAFSGQAAAFRATRRSRPDGTPASDDVILKFRFQPPPDSRIQRDIAAMEQISHTSLASLIEYGCCEVGAGHTRYLAWEFVAGQSLGHRLKVGPLRESEVLGLGRDVSAAIAAIWAKRVVHGSIMPSNILLRDSGGAVLIDLGAAKYLDQANSLASHKPFGSGYFSPEQVRAEKNLCYASDIFSLGLVLLESLLGRHPTDHQQQALAYGIRVSGGAVAASVGLVVLLDKMLSARPVFRPLPADLSRNFQRLLQRMEEDLAISAPEPKQAHG